MKKKRLFCCLLLFALVLCFIADAAAGRTSAILNSAGQGIVQLSSQKGKPKVVSVILDNSSSMVKKDEGDKAYTTRWIEADYAVKALAAMMDEGDILRLYVMSGYREDRAGSLSSPGEITITNSKKDAIQGVGGYLEQMEFSNLTYFQGVSRAANDMRSCLAEGKDCWIVILTDGAFYKPRKLNAGELTAELKGFTEPDVYGPGQISVAYIPIGDGAVSIAEDREHGIYVSDAPGSADSQQEGSILKQVTDVINRIYGRVRLETEIENKYLGRGEGEILFHFDIPLEKLLVFLQKSGSEQRFADFQKNGGDEAEIVIDTPAISPQLNLREEISFEGRRDLPGYEDGKPGYDPGAAKYKDLQGVMLTYAGNSDAENNYQDQKLTIPVNSQNNQQPDIEVYYQPAVKVKLEFLQDGESVVHTEECLSTMNREGHEEYCLHEGELTVRLELQDPNGNPLTDKNSGLLYKDKFSVTLYSEEELTQEKMAPAGTDYEYTGTLQRRNYKILVTTPWDVQETGSLRVQERRKELDAALAGTDAVWLDAAADGGSLIKIQMYEEGSIPSPEILERMSLEFTCLDDSMEIRPAEDVTNTEPGVWACRAFLKDPSHHQAGETAAFRVSASRAYDVGEPVTLEKDFTLPLTSQAGELTVTAEDDKAIDALPLLTLPKEVSLIYTCGEPLSKEQKKQVEITDFHVEPEELAAFISVGEDGDLHIKNSFQWMQMRTGTAKISFNAAYKKWNSLWPGTAAVSLQIRVIPAWVPYFIAGVIIFAILWIAACLVRARTHTYIHKFRAELGASSLSLVYPLRLKRKLHFICPFYNYAKLSYEAPKDADDLIMPSIQVKLCNNKYGNGYEIVNYNEFLDPETFQIGGMAITDDNRIFGKEKLFSMVDRKGVKLYMRIID